MNKVLTITYLLLASQASFAQQPPTDIDLRAAYCLPIVNHFASQMAAMLQADPGPLSPEDAQEFKNEATEAKERADHVKPTCFREWNILTQLQSTWQWSRKNRTSNESSRTPSNAQPLAFMPPIQWRARLHAKSTVMRKPGQGDART